MPRQTTTDGDAEAGDEGESGRRRRRRGGRGRKGKPDGEGGESDETTPTKAGPTGTSRRGLEQHLAGGGAGAVARAAASDGDGGDDPDRTVVHVREPRKASDEISGVKGSTRLEAKKQRRREGREQGRRRPPILTESEFLARREAVDRVMVVRQQGDRTQIGVLEDDVLVEHYVAQRSASTMVGNVYLGQGAERAARAWRPPSSTSAADATPCSTPVRSTGTPRASTASRAGSSTP